MPGAHQYLILKTTFNFEHSSFVVASWIIWCHSWSIPELITARQTTFGTGLALSRWVFCIRGVGFCHIFSLQFQGIFRRFRQSFRQRSGRVGACRILVGRWTVRWGMVFRQHGQIKCIRRICEQVWYVVCSCFDFSCQHCFYAKRLGICYSFYFASFNANLMT